MKYACMLFASLLIVSLLPAQTITGKIFDAQTKEPLAGAIISDHQQHQVQSDIAGHFILRTSDLSITVSMTGFATRVIRIWPGPLAISLQPTARELDQVVVTANRTLEKRSEAPVSISVINKQTIEDTKAQRLDNLLNKVSGVFMVNLGNEQHEMSIRQPMTTNSRFLYMEDGLPIRTTGVYNHNALLEMNMTAIKSIEVIKGPSSALYGGEAIGGAINAITQAAPAFTSGSFSAQLNNTGYMRADAQVGSGFGKTGLIASGYYASRNNGPIEHSDYHKLALTLRSDTKFNNRLTWINTLSYINYYSDMTGALDSAKFALRNLSSLQTFTYRITTALRYKSMLTQQWNSSQSTSFSLLLRDNSVKQNPSYVIASTANPLLFRGQVNNNSFATYAVFIQHVAKFNWMKSKLVAGMTVDVSPQSYAANFIWINKDPASNKYVSFFAPARDSVLSNYKTNIRNTASYLDYEMNPLKNLRLVIALRYDDFRYDFRNALPPSAATGAPSAVSSFHRLTPKTGFTYNRRGIGFYGNYSQGYVPPQITELFNNSTIPYLQPQTFYNYEVGGWLSLLRNRLYADWSLYLMNGTNEIISVRQADGSFVNQNAGKTRHYGIEYGINYQPNDQWKFRFSATNAKHVYLNNIVKGIDFSGKEISASPHFVSNAQISFQPVFVKGLRLSAEWQHQSRYFMDDLDQYRYHGFDVMNLRAGYRVRGWELWVNALNVFNSYYAVLATKSTSAGNASYSYQLGDPREITVGIGYHFGKQ